MTYYCLVGRTTKDVLTYQGKAIVWHDKEEMEFLFPKERVEKLPSYFSEDLTLPLSQHPNMDTVKFPLKDNMNQFSDKTP